MKIVFIQPISGAYPHYMIKPSDTHSALKGLLIAIMYEVVI